ncbi:CAP domain-containing protein [Euzebya sp.]|uniref:CAP domain-containing protein n=1 Tax=Euzebya sp. TaxID=1971409 RepID=UPI0035176D59
MLRSLRLLIAVGLLLTTGLVVPASAQAPAATTFHSGAEDGFVAAINSARAAQGLAPLVVNAELRGVAQGWSAQLRDAGRLSHNPHYADQYTGQRSRMGENVGTATAPGWSADTLVARLHEAFMASSGHRANILGDYNQVGVGVVIDGSTMWVTVNFLQGPVPTPPPVVERHDEPTPPRPTPVLPGHFRRP